MVLTIIRGLDLTRSTKALNNLELSVKNNVAVITLNRPKAFNALDKETSFELMKVSIRCHEDPEIRAAVITGSGKAFCAGGDLPGFATAGDQVSSAMLEMTTYLHGAISRFARMSPPLVSAVNGVAAGAGMSLACSTDLAIAGESAKFTMAYTKAGLTPDGSSTFFLARLVGLRRAQELVLTNRVLSAEEALDWGLINRIVPDAEVLSSSVKLAEDLALGPTEAFGSAKRLLLASAGDDLEAQMERETRAIANAAKGPDGKEGIAAFVAKRSPEFVGR
tara:strand:- start:935 stop:1768 length:834 start_codon:yes stop_codon:yes gene_type:complete